MKAQYSAHKLFIGLSMLAAQCCWAKAISSDEHQHHDHSMHMSHSLAGTGGMQSPGASSLWMFEPSQAKAATVPPQMNPVTPAVNCPAGTSDEPFGDHAPNDCPPPSIGDPISLTDGSFWMSVPCFKLGGAGQPIVFSLHYDTHKWADDIGYTGIGIGWAGSYSRRLNPKANEVFIVLEDGAWKRWSGNSAAGFVKQGGNNASLTFNATATEYTVGYINGDKDIFSEAGLLKRTEDRYGNVTIIGDFSVSNGVGRRTISNNRTNQSLILEHADVNNLWRLTRVVESGSNAPTPRQMTLEYGATGNNLNKLIRVTESLS